MRVAAHELYGLNDLTMSCLNSITCVGFFINHAEETELRSILQRHLEMLTHTYNMHTEYLSKVEGSQSLLMAPIIHGVLSSNTRPPTVPVVPVAPRTNAQRLNDREIATNYMLTLKRIGREYAWTAMEMSNPQLRTFLEEGFRLHSHLAYDMWQWMVPRGFFSLEPAPERAMTTVALSYGPLPGHGPTLHV